MDGGEKGGGTEFCPTSCLGLVNDAPVQPTQIFALKKNGNNLYTGFPARLSPLQHLCLIYILTQLIVAVYLPHN